MPTILCILQKLLVTRAACAIAVDISEKKTAREPIRFADFQLNTAEWLLTCNLQNAVICEKSL